MSAKM